MDSVVLTTTTAHVIYISCPLPGQLQFNYLKLSSTGGYLINIQAPGVVVINNIDFGSASTAYHILCACTGGYLNALSSTLKITGGAVNFAFSNNGGRINLSGGTITLSGTPAITYFFEGSNCGVVQATGMTYSGSGSGQIYYVTMNGVVSTAGSGAPSGFSGYTSNTGGEYS